MATSKKTALPLLSVLAQLHRPHRHALHEPPLATRCNHDGRALDPSLPLVRRERP